MVTSAAITIIKQERTDNIVIVQFFVHHLKMVYNEAIAHFSVNIGYTTTISHHYFQLDIANFQPNQSGIFYLRYLISGNKSANYVNFYNVFVMKKWRKLSS